MSEHKDSDAFGNAVAPAALSIVHGKGQGMLRLATDVAEEHFAQACVDVPVALTAAVLKR